MEWIDYGVGGLEAATLDRLLGAEHDLAALYKLLATAGELLAFEASERFYEIGTPAALSETDAFLRARQRVTSKQQALHDARVA
jgi:NDP-sugar pyrophosphorylase family protein